MGGYSNWIMELLSKDNDKYRKENEALKGIINKFVSGEYTKERMLKEFQAVIDKGKIKNL
jgi:hypothetical protein